MREANIKTIVITGASSGIGLVVARELARKNWRVIAHGRDPDRSSEAMEHIRKAAPDARVDMLLADLSTMAEVDRFAGEVAAMTDRIDVLANNAGFIPAEQVVTSDGLEQCFAANHLAPFLLTNRLLPLLKAAGPGAPAAPERAGRPPPAPTGPPRPGTGPRARASLQRTRAA